MGLLLNIILIMYIVSTIVAQSETDLREAKNEWRRIDVLWRNKIPKTIEIHKDVTQVVLDEIEKLCDKSAFKCDMVRIHEAKARNAIKYIKCDAESLVKRREWESEVDTVLECKRELIKQCLQEKQNRDEPYLLKLLLDYVYGEIQCENKTPYIPPYCAEASMKRLNSIYLSAFPSYYTADEVKHLEMLGCGKETYKKICVPFWTCNFDLRNSYEETDSHLINIKMK